MSGHFENVDGHRVWVETPDAPVAVESPPQSGAFPEFTVRPDYMTCMVAVLFDPADIRAVAAHPLFAGVERELRSAAADVEQEIEFQILRDRDRTLTGGAS